MKSFLRFVTNPWFLSILGLIAISLLIFFVGPLIGFGDSRPFESLTVRLVTILIIVILWMLNQLRKALAANRANKEMVEGIVEDSGAADPDRSADELATLGKRFEEAVAVLKKSKGKKGSLNLYDLPWYVIIGPPGSGKTTALVNSGLEFPLAERFGKEALRGVGGTRNCDWWFTEEAILLDTAGRYTTQDSDSRVDSSGWTAFLGLLKKYRKRRPINGVLIAISLSDLMTLGESERLAHARAIKSRIQELDEFFGIRFPVYVMLTKCDLIAGFSEFFDDLGRAEREQILGATFSLEDSSSPTGAVERFGAEFDAILERLGSRVLWRLSGERDIRRRAAIYGFPRQLASLKEPISSFLNDVFRGSRFEEAPMLRGIYLTSGTQEGTPIDRLMSTVARTFGLDQQMLPSQGGQGRSYFLTSLFKNVVFAESEIAGTNRRLELRRAWLQRAAYAGSLVLTGLIIVGWGVSYANNRALVNEAAAATDVAARALDDTPPENRDPLVVLPALNAVRDLPSGYDDDSGRWLSRLGLYQGNKLGRQATNAYRRVLVEVLLPRLILRMEDQLRGGGPSPDYQYEALKAYLMLDSKDHYDASEIVAWIRFDLASNMRREVNTAQRESLSGHLDALFAEQPLPLPLPLDQALIDATQRIVARMPTEERVYSRLKRKSLGEELREFTIFNAAGPRSQLVFSRKTPGTNLNEGIPGLYTRDGYRKIFLSESAALTAELTNESWILGPYTPPATEQALLMSRVKELYLDDFSRLYENLIFDIDLAPFSTTQEAVNILNILSDPVNSPLVLLLEAVQAETQLDVLPATANIDTSGADDAAEKLEQLLGAENTPQAVTEVSAQLNRVQQRFKWVDDLVGGEDPQSAPIQHLLGLIQELYRFMATVVSQQGPEGTIPTHVAGQGQAVIQQIKMEASRQPEMMQGLLSAAATGSQTIVFGGVTAQLNNAWRSRGLPECRRAIAGRYPIDRSSDQEIRLDDFGMFFGPGGVADSFFQEYLINYVDMSRSPWRVRSSGAVPIQISAAALRQFERANAIKETFFRGGGALPSVGFEMRPLGMDATISQFTLNLAGKQISYSFGPSITEYMDWPGPDLNAEVRIEMSPPVPGSGSMLRERGPWAWFRVLDKANITPAAQPEQFTVEFRLGDRSATYELIARSAYNPFRFEELEQFRCPESL